MIMNAIASVAVRRGGHEVMNASVMNAIVTAVVVAAAVAAIRRGGHEAAARRKHRRHRAHVRPIREQDPHNIVALARLTQRRAAGDFVHLALHR